jgi:subtilisin family serine protease
MYSLDDVGVQLAAFDSPEESADVPAESLIVLCEVRADKLEALEGKRKGQYELFAFDPPELFHGCGCSGGSTFGLESSPFSSEAEAGMHPFDLATSAAGIDCRPFRPGVAMSVIRDLLGVQRVWDDGFTGQNVVVGILDEGVNAHYPVIGGYSRSGAYAPGRAPIASHGSMCAADVLVAAPAARLLDYPIFDRAGNGLDPLPAWTAVLNQRRLNGTPHMTNNSYGFYTIPPAGLRSSATDPNHPVNRMIRTVVATGITCFFAAGNCGAPCPTGRCNNGLAQPVEINGANSLEQVITVAAVNSRRDRIGYSSQGPGTFPPNRKPDVSGYSHFFANFGHGRPGGMSQPFDNGTSAATPVVAGVAALLASAFPALGPTELNDVLTRTAINLGQPGWDADTGHGVVHAGAAYTALRNPPQPASDRRRNR